ncbi:MAG TPA: OmpA family protein [Thermoanaerobaculia bacterium]|jgi:outer membrane protein OmpA-like peptidoglycan-associated protein
MRTQRSILTLACAGLLGVFGCASTPPPPELAQARLAIEDAKAANAPMLVPEEYNAATAHWSIADRAWAERKDEDNATHFARLAEAEAREAQYKAEAKTAQAALEAQAARKAQLELTVRDAQIIALQAQARSEAERREAEARAAAERARVETENLARTQAERDRAAAELARTQAALEASRQAAEEERQRLEQQRQAEAARAAEAERLRLEQQRQAEAARNAELERLRAEQVELRTTLAKLADVREDPRGLVVTLPGSVYFDVNRSEIKPDMRARLQEIGTLLAKNAQPKILVEGHTDADGSSEYNLQLSRLRAESVRSVLVGAGVSPERIETTGYGETQPRASNATSSGKAQNRRVEIIIEGASSVAIVR